MNKILLMGILSLLTLSGCAGAGMTPAVTMAPETGGSTEAVEATSGLSTQAPTEPEETEARYLLPHAIAYQVDLTHDERPELLVVDECVIDGAARLEVSLTKGDQRIWSGDVELTGGMTRRGYFLCSVGSDDYLVSYRVYLDEAEHRYIGEVFYISDEGAVVPVDNEALTVYLNSFDHYPLETEEIEGFANWMNWFLSRSTLLCYNDQGNYSYSLTTSQKQYTETFPELFAPIMDYGELTEISDKVEEINRLLYRQWFGGVEYNGGGAEEGQAELIKPEGFDDAANRILDASWSYIWMGAELHENTELWFMDYREEKDLQIILSEESYTSPLTCDDIIYYRAPEDQSLEDVARYMIERMVAEMTVPSERRPFSITDYRVLDQDILDVEGGLEECWQSYLWKIREETWTIEEYIWRWLGDADEVYGFIPVGEDIWYFVPNGIFSFDGTCRDGKTMDELAADPRDVVGGKISFVTDEPIRSIQFVLMKDGDVYRMQRAEAMETLYPELLERGAEAVAMAETEEDGNE